MSKGKCGPQFRLKLMVSAAVFGIQFLSILTGMIMIYLLVRAGVISAEGKLRSGAGHILLMMIIVSNLIGSAIAFAVSRIPLEPIRNILRQINRLAAGDFKARLYFGELLAGHPFFKELSNDFNKMAEELENTEMLRGDFINNFSHEFKTPIVSIAGFAKLLRRGDLTEVQKEEYLAVIEEESLRLSSMATNVLNLTKVENQAILTDVSRFNLSEQLRSCILLLADKWEKKELDFQVEFGEYMISASEELLKQVWINLIDNAVKFSPPGGVIEVGIERKADRIVVSVINAGEVIPSESQARIFRKFYQADSSHSREGNGIGLAIAKRVTELHHGRISVQSENNRTIFRVELPVNAVAGG